MFKHTVFKAAAMAVAALGMMAGSHAAQDGYPNHAIRMVVPSGPGSITDQTARVLADDLSKAFNQSVVVENKPGANGILASEYVARAAPDGYTLLFTYAATHVMNPWLIAELPYDPVKDFTPIAQPSGGGGNVLIVNAAVPANNLQELIAYVKNSKEDLSYCSWGVGSGGHLTMAYVMARTGMSMRHIPYKTAVQCVNDVAAGHVPIAFADTVSPLAYIRGGKIRPIAVSGPIRIDSLEGVPTLVEQGVDFDNASWLGIFGPKGLPPEIVTKVNQAVNDIITSPEKRERFIAMNLRPGERTTPEQFGQRVKDDIVSWGEVVRLSGVKAE